MRTEKLCFFQSRGKAPSSPPSHAPVPAPPCAACGGVDSVQPAQRLPSAVHDLGGLGPGSTTKDVAMERKQAPSSRKALATKPRLEGGFLTTSRDSYSAIYSTKCPTAVVQTFNLLPLPANCRWSIFRNYRSSIPIPNVTEPKEASKEP